MNCPVDSTELRMSDRQGVEIDYCPQCRGVWLDRGELDKILERSSTVAPREEYREQSGYRHEGDSHYRGRKPKSVWKELFDF